MPRLRKPVHISRLAPTTWINQSSLQAAASNIADRHAIAFIYLAENLDFATFSSSNTPFWKIDDSVKKVVILWGATPMDPAAMFSWRCGLIEISGISFKFLTLPDEGPENWEEWLTTLLGAWTKTNIEKEETGFENGDLVHYRKNNPLISMSGYDPAFLTISPKGVMARVLEQLDECKRMYHEIISGEPLVKRQREEVYKVLDQLLAADYSQEKDISKRREAIRELSESLQQSLQEQHFMVNRSMLPKVLLLGPSGVGKTLVARYLAWRLADPGESESRPFKRIPIPEYLHKENDFEFDVYGYCHGAYTGALPGGKRGFLLENIGGVIFFDEIGDANRPIQAKLLAYLDDYQVTPRGWSGEPVFCPMLLVAATNRNIDKWAARDDGESDKSERFFRNDLFRRFNHLVRIPSIKERKEELPFILDTMLQMEAFNPGGEIRGVGKKALDAFTNHDFSKGNFRDVENLVREACRMARNDGRTYLVKSDITRPDSHTQSSVIHE